MFSERRVTIYAKSTAVSVTPVRPGKTYPLSALDHAMGRHTVRLVFYYRPSPTMERDRLKESLAEVLSYYPAVTGRLSWNEADGGWVVKCNDAGVRLLDARARGTLDEWLASAGDDEEMELAYWEPMGADPTIWSPFYVQITEFEDKAVAIGLSCPHIHSDPTCAMLLVRAWSDAHRRACITFPPFFHPPAFLPRPAPNPSAPLLALKSSFDASKKSVTMSSATFVFAEAAIKTLLADLLLDTTPFAALAALFWSRIALTSGPDDHHQIGSAELTLGLDFRKRMQAPLPHGFYGNSLHFTCARADLGTGLGHVATELDRHFEGVREEEFWEATEWLHERHKANKAAARAFQMYGPELTCVKLDHVLVYGAAFEKDGGRPTHVTCRVGGLDGDGLVLVMPAAEEMARTVSVTLPEEVTARICRDDAIMKYGPTLIFTARR